MIQLLILSDTHGKDALLRSLLEANRNVDAILFLGDGLNGLEALLEDGGYPPAFCVRGNCDSETSFLGRSRDEELLLTLGGRRLLLLHGHTVGAKGSRSGLLSRAAARGADAVLFGHTHVPMEAYLGEEEGGPLWLFNPGSLGKPYDGYPSYGRLIIGRGGDLLFSHGVWEEHA